MHRQPVLLSWPGGSLSLRSPIKEALEYPIRLPWLRPYCNCTIELGSQLRMCMYVRELVRFSCIGPTTRMFQMLPTPLILLLLPNHSQRLDQFQKRNLFVYPSFYHRNKQTYTELVAIQHHGIQWDLWIPILDIREYWKVTGEYIAYIHALCLIIQ